MPSDVTPHTPKPPQPNDPACLGQPPTSHHGHSRSSWGLPDSHAPCGVQGSRQDFQVLIYLVYQ